MHPDDITEMYDIVLLLTKQVYNEPVLAKVRTILKEDGILVSLQNGVPEEFIQQQIPRERTIIAGSVEFGATYVGPGESRLTSDYEHFKTYAMQIGELDGKKTDRIIHLKEILDHIGVTESLIIYRERNGQNSSSIVRSVGYPLRVTVRMATFSIIRSCYGQRSIRCRKSLKSVTPTASHSRR